MATILYTQGYVDFEAEGVFVELRRWSGKHGRNDVVLEFGVCGEKVRDEYGESSREWVVERSFERLNPSWEDYKLIRYAIDKYDEMEVLYHQYKEQKNKERDEQRAQPYIKEEIPF